MPQTHAVAFLFNTKVLCIDCELTEPTPEMNPGQALPSPESSSGQALSLREGTRTTKELTKRFMSSR
ncbi:MAG TPA: hypothetical protein DHV28_15320 [Ignavibacteriales bacterium]|nr:hypothetical protein [Ignavibacteriales bacterium]